MSTATDTQENCVVTKGSHVPQERLLACMGIIVAKTSLTATCAIERVHEVEMNLQGATICY